jgi:pimeloyl-ACP methyl ester carboxylesterase
MTAPGLLQTLPAPRTLETRMGPFTFVDHGEGPVALALHGAMGAWDQGVILARLAAPEGCRIIAPSRPGYPGTPDQGDNGPEAQAAVMIALLEALGVAQCLVVAISGGGPCAIRMALARPDLCRGLVLVSTVSGPNPVVIPGRFAILRAVARVPGLPGLFGKLAVGRIDKAAERAFPDPEQRQRVLGDPATRALYLALTASTFDAMPTRLRASENDFRVTATESYPLEDLRVPVLIAHGTQDPYVDFQSHAVGARNRIPGAVLVPLEGAGHAAIFTHGAQVRTAVAGLLHAPGGKPAFDAGRDSG